MKGSKGETMDGKVKMRGGARGGGRGDAEEGHKKGEVTKTKGVWDKRETCVLKLLECGFDSLRSLRVTL